MEALSGSLSRVEVTLERGSSSHTEAQGQGGSFFPLAQAGIRGKVSQVNWRDYQQVARVRAVEETDTSSKVWEGSARRAATHEAARLAGPGRREEAFLAKRAALLVRATGEPLERTLVLPVVPGWLVVSGLVLAFGVGWALSALGQEREINLLALPLLGVLAWNAAVILLSIIAWLRPGRAGDASAGSGGGAGIEALFRKVAGWKVGESAQPVNKLPPGAQARFLELARPAWRGRLAARFRAWLHLGAALIALGSTAGMLARGWSRDYRAVWESTLLESPGASRFLGSLFAPASAVTGIDIPLEKIAAMQRVDGRDATQSDSARDWIYLYGATLGLLVVMPRLLLLLLELLQARRAPSRALQSADWQAYARRLLALVEGAGAPAQILTHGLAVDDTARDRWRQWVTTVWRDAGKADFLSVPVASETDFLAQWRPAAPRVALIFNMANVPEAEVQVELAMGVANRLREQSASIPLLLVLDDTDLRKRWSGFSEGETRLNERAATWREMLKDVPGEWAGVTSG